MEPPVFVDGRYETGLGTGFYDRLAELEKLERLLETYTVVIVYGPRGVGKSELLRYYATRKLRDASVVLVDARRLRAKQVEEAAEAVIVPREAAELARLLAERLAREIGVFDLALAVFDTIVELYRRYRRVLIIVDEFHLLPRYSGRGVHESIVDLEAIAGLLSKEQRYSKIRMVLTVSEGFAATSTVKARLRGYRAAWMLVEHLDRLHFERLCLEYGERHGCRLGCCEVEALVGGTPGYLPLLCSTTREALEEELVRSWLLDIESALGSAVKRLGDRGGGLSIRDVLEAAYTIMSRRISPLREPSLYSVAEALVEHNIVYPLEPGGTVFRPVYPVYRVAVELALRKGGVGPAELDPHEVYREALRRAGCRV